MYQALFVDDDRFLIQGMPHVLSWETYGFASPLTACSVKEATGLFLSHKIDLLITDIEMPGGSGFDLLSFVQEKYPETVYCLLSGHARFDYARNAVQLHAFDYLLKPVRQQDLEALLQKFTELHTRKTEAAVKKYSPLVEDTINYVQAHLKDSISRETITRELHVSEGHISHLFRKETGFSLTEYITNMRIEKAKELLLRTNDSITEICEQIGYNYQAYFTKVFREKTGLSPYQYRKEKR